MRSRSAPQGGAIQSGRGSSAILSPAWVRASGVNVLELNFQGTNGSTVVTDEGDFELVRDGTFNFALQNTQVLTGDTAGGFTRGHVRYTTAPQINLAQYDSYRVEVVFRPISAVYDGLIYLGETVNNSSNHWRLFGVDSTQKIRLLIQENSSNIAAQITADDDYVLNDWNSVIVEKSGAQISLELNGVKKTTDYNSAPVIPLGNALYIGRKYTGSNITDFEGQVQRVAITAS